MDAITKRTNELHSQSAILRELGEFGAIERFASRLKLRSGVRVGIGDDCAVLDSLKAPVVSCDALVEGVHFRRDWTSAFDLGRKTLAVSVSDLASSGARPVAAFISLCAPPDLELAWLDAFYDGMESLAAQFDFSVAGGDTTRANQLVLSATLIGELLPEAENLPLLRDGARLGDIVCVSGDLGASAGGLALLLAGVNTATDSHRAALRRHFDPTPRLETMRAILRANRGAVHAAMDISDGLIGDAKHIATRSNVHLRIDAARVPINDSTRFIARELNQNAFDWALTGGEDYELLLCVAPKSFDELQRATPTPLTAIGEVIEGAAGVDVVGEVEGTGWTHF